MMYRAAFRWVCSVRSYLEEVTTVQISPGNTKVGVVWLAVSREAEGEEVILVDVSDKSELDCLSNWVHVPEQLKVTARVQRNVVIQMTVWPWTFTVRDLWTLLSSLTQLMTFANLYNVLDLFHHSRL